MSQSMPGNPSTVLIVDDDSASREILSRYLASAGYHVITAAGGAEAMRILLTSGPRLVLCDWLMPEMNGLQLCRNIRDHEALPYTFVLLMSAQTRNEDGIVEAFEAGADDYLAKPVGQRELLARVRAGERIVHLQSDLDRRNVEVHRSNAELEIAYMELAEANTKLNRLATVDPVTGLTNRRAAMEHLNELWTGTERHNVPLACIMLDIDYFKNFNDLFGHAVGDEVLREVGAALQKATRRGERCCRIGGEEFLVLCPHSTEAMAAVGAERLRRCVAEHVIRAGNLSLSVTVSAGVAQRTPAMVEPDEMMRAADEALYAAKDAGRNRIALAGADSPDAGSNSSRAARIPLPLLGQNLSHILILDDDTASRTITARMLSADGYSVHEVASVDEGLRHVIREPTHVVVLEASMAPGDGFEFIRKIKAASETRNIPIILTVGRGATTELAAAIEAGADEYITRPLNAVEMSLRVRSMLRLRRELVQRQDARSVQSRAIGLLLDQVDGVFKADSLESVQQVTLRVAAKLVGCDHAAILTPSGSRGLTVAAELNTDGATPAPPHTATAELAFSSGRPVIINSPEEAETWSAQPGDEPPPSVPFVAYPLTAADRVMGVLVLARRTNLEPFSKPELEYLGFLARLAAVGIRDIKSRGAREDARDSLVVALARLAEYRDADSGRHLDRVTRYSVLLAQQLRAAGCYAGIITDGFIHALQQAVPLHDIGKVAVPDHVLNKPGPLDPQELLVMRAHASIGASTIRTVLERAPGTPFLVLAEEIAHSHHEWFNGAGYPRGLSGTDIPLSARIASLADAYDALTTWRVYKDAMTHARAVQTIREASGTQFDPDVVEAFLQREQEFKALAVELTDGAPPPCTRPLPAKRIATSAC